jgi:peptide deformylase
MRPPIVRAGAALAEGWCRLDDPSAIGRRDATAALRPLLCDTVYFAMPIRPIVRLGHPALRTPAKLVAPEAIGSPELQTLVDDMVETMRAAHGVGLAAPQIGLSLQLFVYQAATKARSPGEGIAEEVTLQTVINPMITPQGGEMVEDWEGCLSIPDLRGLVPRHPAVRVRGLDRDGQPLDYLVKGFTARIVQHEFDHLNGVVFLDRMRDFRSLAFYDEWEQFMAEGGEEQGQIASDPASDPAADPTAVPAREPAPAGREPG